MRIFRVCVPALPVLGLLFALTSPSFAGPVVGIGVMGDSPADEYQFAEILPPGGDRRLERSFVESIHAERGYNFGAFSTDSRGTPRGRGFEYNWALEGDRSDDLIAHGQHTGLAAQAAQWKVNLAWIFVGGNDFRDLYDPAVIGSPDPGAKIQETVVKLATNVATAVGTLLTANPELNVVVANLPDLRAVPGLKAAIASTPGLDQWAAAVDQGAQAYNAQLESMFAGNDHVAIADAYALSQPAVAGVPVPFRGFTLDTNIPGNGPGHYFVDALHPSTGVSILLGNLFIEASNAKFATNLEALPTAIPLPAAVYPGAMMLLATAGYTLRRRAA